jgi:hypothetical protein
MSNLDFYFRCSHAISQFHFSKQPTKASPNLYGAIKNLGSSSPLYRNPNLRVVLPFPTFNCTTGLPKSATNRQLNVDSEAQSCGSLPLSSSIFINSFSEVGNIAKTFDLQHPTSVEGLQGIPGHFLPNMFSLAYCMQPRLAKSLEGCQL